MRGPEITTMCGANGEGRTPIPLREPDPKSGASANSATLAFPVGPNEDCSIPLRQRLHDEVLVHHDAALVMLLQGEVALHVGVLLIHVIDGGLAVDFDDDMISLRDDVLVEPRFGRNKLLQNVLE